VVRVPANKIVMRAMVTPEKPFLLHEIAAHSDSVIINGSFFDQNFVPTGFVKDGNIISQKLFDFDKSGAIFFDQGMVQVTGAMQNDFVHASGAVQSYPVLIQDGISQVQKDSGHRARRTAVARDEKNNLVIIIADETEISLYEFARALATLTPHITTALNLDGGPSTGMVVRSSGKITEEISNFLPVSTAIEFSRAGGSSGP
jgi:exopolysaccharide biosynthesis protein